jgi:hypothetical protein
MDQPELQVAQLVAVCVAQGYLGTAKQEWKHWIRFWGLTWQRHEWVPASASPIGQQSGMMVRA